MRLVYVDYSNCNNGLSEFGRCMVLYANNRYTQLIQVGLFQYQAFSKDNNLNLQFLGEFFLDSYGVMNQRLLFIDFSIPKRINVNNQIITYYEIGFLSKYALYDSTNNVVTGLNIDYPCGLNISDLRFNNEAYRNCFNNFLMSVIPQQILQTTLQSPIPNTVTITNTTEQLQDVATTVEPTSTVPEQNIIPTAETAPTITLTFKETNTYESVLTITKTNQETVSAATVLEESKNTLQLSEEVGSLENDLSIVEEKLILVAAEEIETAKEANSSVLQAPIVTFKFDLEKTIQKEDVVKKESLIPASVKNNVANSPVSPKLMVSPTNAKRRKAQSKQRPKQQSPINDFDVKDDEDEFLDRIIAEQKATAVVAIKPYETVRPNTNTLSAFQLSKTHKTTLCEKILNPGISHVQAVLVANLCVIYFVTALHINYSAAKNDSNKSSYDPMKILIDCCLANGLLNSGLFLCKSLQNKNKL